MVLVDEDKATVEWLETLLCEYFGECPEGEDGYLEKESPVLWYCHLPSSFPWKMYDAVFMHEIVYECGLLTHWNYER